MITVNSKEELKALINKRIEEQGPNCDLNDIDVSSVENMYSMFRDSKFKSDISKWDVSRVKEMEDMFKDSPLDGREPSWYRD